MTDVAARWRACQERLERACERVDRDPGCVELMAVSKRQPIERLVAAHEAGARCFGENYVQDWRSRAEDPRLLKLRGLRWHFIGALQRNKIKHLLGRVALIEAVDRLKLARELSKRALEAGRPVSVLLAVNLSAEPSKSGFLAGELPALLPELVELVGIQIEGLMSIPPHRPDPEASRPDHRQLRELRDRLQDGSGHALPQLSMGMSADFEIAIEEGSTRVRVGTGIFGPRPG